MAASGALRFSTYADLVGQTLATSEWTLIDQERINQFATCTGDRQWIHVDVERARKESPFGGTIAHGFLTLSLIAEAILTCGALPSDASRILNAGVDQVRFKTPVRAGSRVRSVFSLTSVSPKGEGRLLAQVGAVLEIDGESMPALTAELTVMLFS